MTRLPREAHRGRLPLEELAADRRLLRATILRLAWPVAAEMLLHTLTAIADMVMVSRLGREAVAAVGLSFRPMFLVMSIFLGVGAGTTALVSRAIGRRDSAEANQVAHQSILATIGLAAVLASCFWAGAPAIIRFMGAAPDVAGLGVGYMRAVAWGMGFMYVSMVATAALRGAGDTHTSMRVNLVANLINIVLNYGLIFGHWGLPRLEVAGAGIASSVARMVAGCAIAGLWLARRLVLAPPAGRLGLQPGIIWRIARVGAPAMAERILMSLAMILHLRMVAVEGTVAVAAATLSQNIEELSLMPSIGISVAASALVGQFLGHGRPDAAEASGRESARVALRFMATMGALFVLVPGVWLRIYAPRPDLLPLATVLVRWTGVAQPFMALAFVYAGALRGAGDTQAVMRATALSMWGVRLVLTWGFMNVLGWGAPGAWAAMTIDNAVRAIALSRIFDRGRWKGVRV